MHQSRFDNILNSQSGTAQKIFNCIPVDAQWSTATIYFECKRKQLTTANRGVVERCLHELRDAGLLKEGPKGTFHRILPHRQQAQVIKRDPVIHPRVVKPEADPVTERGTPVSTPPTVDADRNLAKNGHSTREQLSLEPSIEKPPTAVVIVATTPSPETVVAKVGLTETVQVAPPVVEDRGVEAVDYAPQMPISYYERYMELRLEHGVTMLRELAFAVDTPISQAMLELAADFDRLKKLVKRVPELERQPVATVVNPYERLTAKPDDQAELKAAIAASEARDRVSKKSTTPEYKIWTNIRHRQGVEMDPRWNTFETFLSDVGYRPTPNARLLRVDKSKGFSRGNMRWKDKGKLLIFVHTPPAGWPWDN